VSRKTGLFFRSLLLISFREFFRWSCLQVFLVGLFCGSILTRGVCHVKQVSFVGLSDGSLLWVSFVGLFCRSLL